jgi:hypothetical protein
MNRQPGIILAILLAASAYLHADTSYLLIQGPFGSGSSEETFKFTVNYAAGSLATGQDLLNDIFGTPVPSGTSTDPTFLGQPIESAGNSTMGVTYLSSSYGLLLYSFTLNGVEVDTDDNVPTGTSTLGWNYYVAGGSGSFGGDYADSGSWTLSGDGAGTRNLQNGTFDGWEFGNTGSDPGFTPVGSTATIDGADNAPTTADFIAVPEPSPIALLVIAALPIASLRRREPRAA